MIYIRSSLIFYCLTLYVFIVPTFENTVGSIGAIFVNGVLGVILLLHFLVQHQKILFFVSTVTPLKIIFFSLILLEFLIIISMSYGVFFGEVIPIFRDLYELHKPILYALIVLYSFYVFASSNLSIERVLLLIFIVISVLGLFQLFNFDQFSSLYTGLNVVASNRLTVPFGNPYDCAFVLLFFIFYFFIRAVFQKSIFFFILSFLASYLFVKTGSKSVALSFLVIFFIVMPFIFLKLKNVNKYKFFFLYLLLIGLFVINFDTFIKYNPSLTSQFIQLFESGSIGDSASVRLEQFMFAVEKSNNNFLTTLIGNGPSKLEMEHVESAYTYIYYRYGASGFLVYGFIYFYILLTLYKLIFKNSKASINHQVFYVSSLLWFLAIPASALGGMFIEQPKVSFFYYMVIGFILFKKHQNNLKNES